MLPRLTSVAAGSIRQAGFQPGLRYSGHQTSGGSQRGAFEGDSGPCVKKKG